MEGSIRGILPGRRRAARGGDLFDPVLVLKIPGNRQPKPRAKVMTRSPAQFPLDFGRVNRIAPVVTGAVRYEGYELPGLAAQFRPQFVDQVANPFHDV
jgi:hypothetical protein